MTVIPVTDTGEGSDAVVVQETVPVADTGAGFDTVTVYEGPQGARHETRQHPQTAKMYLAVKKPRAIWKGVVQYTRGRFGGGVPDGDYRIRVSSGANVSGFDVNDFLPNLTAFVGTTEGGNERGKCRVRRISGNDIYVSADLSCYWQAGDHITITDVHEFWPKPHTVHEEDDTIVVLKDHDLDAETHKAEYPVPVLGPPACAFIDEATEVATVRFDARRSYLVPPGNIEYEELGWASQGITAWSWWFEGGTPGTSTDPAPIVTYATPGQYVVRCTVTGRNGKSYRGFRNVFIFEREGTHVPITTFGNVRCSGDLQRHGWEGELEVWGEAASPETLPDGAQAVLFTEEFFAGVPKRSTYGHPGRANIHFVGWVRDAEMSLTATEQRAKVTLHGLQTFMQEQANYAVYLTQADENAPLWSYFAPGSDPVYVVQAGELHGLTVQKTWYHMLHWHWTLLDFVDVYLPQDHNNNLPGQNFPEGSLASQLDSFCKDTQADWGVSREGALYIFSRPNTLAFGWRYERHPTLLSLTTDDFAKIQLVPRTGPKASRVRVEGVMANGTGWSDPTVSSVPGNSKAYTGQALTLSNQVIGHPEQGEELARMTLAEESRKIESVTLDMCGNFSLCDPVPGSRVLLTVSADGGLRGLDWHERPFFVIAQEDRYDADAGAITTKLTLLPEVFPWGVPAHSLWAQALYDEHEQKAPKSGAYTIAATVQRLATPKIRIVPAVMGGGGSLLSGPTEGFTYVRLYSDIAQVVLAENREYKEIVDRPCWVEICDGGNDIGRGGQPLYRIVGVRDGRFAGLSGATAVGLAHGRGYTTRTAVFRLPGPVEAVEAGVGVGDALTVLGSPLYARAIKGATRAEHAPVGGALVANVITTEGGLVGTVAIGDGALVGMTTFQAEVFLPVGTTLILNPVQVGTEYPGAYLTVEVECREYGL